MPIILAVHVGANPRIRPPAPKFNLVIVGELIGCQRYYRGKKPAQWITKQSISF
jgi:hypothetical protein